MKLMGVGVFLALVFGSVPAVFANEFYNLCAANCAGTGKSFCIQNCLKRYGGPTSQPIRIGPKLINQVQLAQSCINFVNLKLYSGDLEVINGEIFVRDYSAADKVQLVGAKTIASFGGNGCATHTSSASSQSLRELLEQAKPNLTGDLKDAVMDRCRNVNDSSVQLLLEALGLIKKQQAPTAAKNERSA